MEPLIKLRPQLSNILLVDDNCNLREVMSIILTDEGYNVLQAENGKNALELLQNLNENEYPTCMILDLMMPVMGGNELLEIIEKNYAEKFGRIPVIIFSAEGDFMSHNQVVARFEKPISIEVICQTIRDTLLH